MSEINQARAFCAIVEQMNIRKAAVVFGVSATMMSKYLKALEDDLGCHLINRNTRTISLTDAGRHYYQHIKPVLQDWRDLKDHMSHFADEIFGHLKITATIEFGGIYLAAIIKQYRADCPHVALELVLTNRTLNLLDEDIDLAIRVAPKLPDSGMIAVPVGQTKLRLWASPQYLSRSGQPQAPEDLHQHACLFFSQTPRANTWLFSQAGQNFELSFDWQWQTDNGRLLNEAAAAGMGIIQAPDYSVADYVKQGRLVEVLAAYRLQPMNISAIYPQRNSVSPKLSHLIELLKQHFGTKSWW